MDANDTRGTPGAAGGPGRGSANEKRVTTTLERKGHGFYRELAAQGRAAFKARLAVDPEYRRTLGEKIRAGRVAAGSARAARQEQCVVPSCRAWFPVPGSQPKRGRPRCPTCAAAGKTVCYSCGDEMATRPGLGSRVRCQACKDARRHGPPLTPTVERLVFTCRGVKKIDRAVTVTGEDGQPVEARIKLTLVDGSGHAKRCEGRSARLPSDVDRWRHHPSPSLMKRGSRTSFDPATMTFQCQACRRLEVSIAALLARARGFRRRSPRAVQTWDDLRDLRHDYYAAVVANDPRCTKNRLDVKHPRAGQGAGGRGLQAYYAAGKRWDRTPEWRARVGRTTLLRWWRVGRTPRRHVARCLRCGKLLLHWKSPTATRTRFHQACWLPVLHSPNGRAWLTRQAELTARLRAEGYAQGDPAALAAEVDRREPPPWLQPITGPKPEPDILTRNFGLAVCHYLGGQDCAALARQLSELGGKPIGRRAVSTAVAEIMALLPEPDVATAHLRRYVLALRAAQAGTGDQAS